ncbi:hypothetical protein J1N35_030886 [Gossypium stocksii]|uniref:Glycine-rich protein n=1 Tax=Gossypium stocksii TaxID=47602 RepID=A0A9D3V342_9ROSI|nr:hypothetical protein J1N35_030886 [Gossypium stocksii]
MSKLPLAKKSANMILILMVIGIALALMVSPVLGKGAGKGGGSRGRGGGHIIKGNRARGHSSSAVALYPGLAFALVQLLHFVFYVFLFV